MTKELRELKKYYLKAVTKKSTVRDRYDSVSRYTDVNTVIYDTDQTHDYEDYRDIEPVITTSISSLVNFVMKSVFARGDRWATMSVDETVYSNISTLKSKPLQDSEIQKINTELEENLDTVFDYLNESNFYTEISRSVRDALNLGTGCLRVLEKDSITKPFAFDYVSNNQLFFLEDVDSNPTFIFKTHNDLTFPDVLELFEAYGTASIPSDYNPETPINIIESVIPNGDGTYNYKVTDEHFIFTFLEETLAYSPYILFRWNLEADYVWGVGLGVQGFRLFRELEEFKAIRIKQAKDLATPPLIATGDKQLLQQFKMEAGYINWGGAGAMAGVAGDPNGTDIRPIYEGQNLLPLDQDILKHENDIRDLFMANPLGSIGDYQNRSATETQARLNMMRDRWAGSFELLQDELLELVLKTVFIIMINRGLIVFDAEKFDYTKINYLNELSKRNDIEEVQGISGYTQTAIGITQYAEAVGLNTEETIKYIADKMNIPESIRLTVEEIIVLQEQQRALKQQAILQQQMKAQIPQGNVQEGGTIE